MGSRYDGAVSDAQPLPGGSGQGTLLGMVFFCVELSDAGMSVPTQPVVTPGINDVASVKSPLPAVTQNEIRVKYT